MIPIKELIPLLRPEGFACASQYSYEAANHLENYLKAIDLINEQMKQTERTVDKLNGRILLMITSLLEKNCTIKNLREQNEELQAKLEAVLDVEIPWQYGRMKLGHTAVVKRALQEQKDDN